jgi:hypothetical protein
MGHEKDQTKVNASSCKENVKDKDPKCTGKTASQVGIVEQELKNEEKNGCCK